MIHNHSQFTKVISGFFITLILISGCSKNSVNFNRMTPEEQLAYAMKYYDKHDYLKAKTEFTMVVLNNAGSSIVEEAQYYLADSHYHLEEYVQAIAEFEKLIRSLPRSKFVDDARYKIGLCYYDMSPGYALDQEYTNKAISQFNMFLEEFPTSDLVPEVNKKLLICREKLAKKEYKTGELYWKMGYYNAAIFSFNDVAENYGDTEFAIKALFFKGECYRKMSKWNESIEAFRAVVLKNNQSDLAEKARAKIAEIQEKIKSKKG